MKKFKCPHCKKESNWENNKFRPFCSEKCKLIDFGDWANESYSIPGKPASPEDIISNYNKDD